MLHPRSPALQQHLARAHVAIWWTKGRQMIVWVIMSALDA
jgi:hypothetical protein